MYYRRISRQQRRKLRAVRLIICGLLLCTAVYLADRQVRPVIRANATIQAKVIATKALNEAVMKQLDGSDTAYSALVSMGQNESGQITSVETNTAAITRIQSSITAAVMENLAQMEQDSVYMALGTLLNPDYFAGRGPRFRFRLESSGYVTTRIVSNFTNAGINQTRHEITFEISVPLSAAIPGYGTALTVSTSYLLADTIIVGAIPEYYTNVVTEDKNLVGEINDYAPNMPDQSPLP